MTRCFVFLMLVGEVVFAAPIQFSDRVEFNQTMPNLSIQGFEEPFDSASSVSFPGFVARENSSVPDIDSRTDYVSVGQRAMGFTWNGDGNFTLEFTTPIDAFAADIIDFGSCCGATDLQVTDESNTWTVTAATGPDRPRGNIQFFGIASDIPFSKLIFSSNEVSTNDLIIFDELVFNAVPETNSGISLGFLFLVAYAIRTRRKAN